MSHVPFWYRNQCLLTGGAIYVLRELNVSEIEYTFSLLIDNILPNFRWARTANEKRESRILHFSTKFISRIVIIIKNLNEINNYY